MLIKYFKYILNNNLFILKLNFKKITNVEYDHDFSNIYFLDYQKNRKLLLQNKIILKKKDEEYYNYHSFNWVKIAKDIGGPKIVKITRDKILDWTSKYNKLYLYILNSTDVSKRIINLIYHYDFYGNSANKNDKIILKFVIFSHYSFLKKYLSTKIKSSQKLIEVKKAILLFEAIHKLNTKKIINQISKGINQDIDSSGLHFSMSPQIHTEYINHLIEIKNIILYFKIPLSKELEFQIINMISVLKNFVHKDCSLAYFNGSNNFHKKNILKVIEYEKDIKIKNLKNKINGLAVFENKEIKIIFDIVIPNNKLITYGLHASTLSFELSFNKEKIITNCGSFINKNKEAPEYLRYSAAHSTIILNNTNISELVKKKSYKRIPKKVEFEFNESENELSWKAGHDGYVPNFKKIVKRQITINKRNNIITGKDEILSLSALKQKTFFNIRFHLTPICKTLLTRGKMSVIIKTNHSAYLFKSNNEICIEETIFINDLNKIVKSSQIVISGFMHNPKKIINWSISKY